MPRFWQASGDGKFAVLDGKRINKWRGIKQEWKRVTAEGVFVCRGCGVVCFIDCREAIDDGGQLIVRDGQGRICHAANED